MTEVSNSHILAAVNSLRLEVKSDFYDVETGIHNIKFDLHELNRRMGTVESRLRTIEETLTPLSKAFNIDSEKVLNHERRISALELRAV